ncbi:hydrolase [Marinobacterium sp. AK62]|uniref:Hydrolase n=1 Tax=Marinobacterium alkalitolerans TaxID=1542925 RepID=A0ABS3Z7M4_9GAMM|nr:hydrolase [Marinobacterium alkalitolerans]MBP0047712.1 hydrolase [Marinobacterium alkalitolerans]
MDASRYLPWLDWLTDRQSVMLEHTIRLSEINSGSLNAAGVDRVGEVLVHLCEPLGGQVERLTVPPYTLITPDCEQVQYPLGHAIRITKRPEAPLQVYLGGHLDTVFSEQHTFQQVRWIDDHHLNGPGVTDLKGGLLVMINALQAFERSPWADQLGWQILLNPDEEIGSLSSADLINAAARQVHLGLIYEPCMPDGSLAGERKGSGNFSVVVKGRAAHAGREHHLGRNAIRALADFISALDQLNGQREGVTLNPGFIHGGGAVNTVPDRCMARFNIRIEAPEDEDWCWHQLQCLSDMINQRDGISLELFGQFGRKPKRLSAANQALLQLARSSGDVLGLALDWYPTGGCCDGNNLAAAGVPNIDTLGVQGGSIHSSDEYLCIDSLVPRAQLSALLLMRLAAEPEARDAIIAGGQHG